MIVNCSKYSICMQLFVQLGVTTEANAQPLTNAHAHLASRGNIVKMVSIIYMNVHLLQIAFREFTLFAELR